MTAKPNTMRATVVVAVILAASAVYAQPSPGLQQSGRVQLAPKAQQPQDLKRQLDARAPGIPALTTPPIDYIFRVADTAPARLMFRWQPGQGGPIDRYKLCVFEATKTCEQPGNMVFTISGNVQEFDPPEGLPRDGFLGKSLRWSVAACRDVLILATPSTPQPTTKEVCIATPPREFHWPLAAPMRLGLSRGSGSEPAVPNYGFAWSAVTGARAYLFCLFDGSSDLCTERITLPHMNPLIVDKGGTDHTITHDLPQFRGKTVRWAVAACTHIRIDQAPSSPLPDQLRCTWQKQPGSWENVRIHNSVLPPTMPRAFSHESQPGSPPPPLEMTWQLNRPQDVRSVKVCILVAERSDGRPVNPEDRMRLLESTNPYQCERRNLMRTPVRPPTLGSCTIRRPFVYTGSMESSVFGFAVAACNEKNECAYPQQLAVIYDNNGPIIPGFPAICN